MLEKIKQEKLKRRLPLTNDYVFKKVFAKAGNEEILKDFLESIRYRDALYRNTKIYKEKLWD